ncbi:copper resistance CopC family protein [Amycolatopsis sp. NPDC051128]|uniref:copper resistance CopC family protein n=1 Tax=Amycolatopsis sp. NPDC051128 TaxID=3155412 RepID=UPI00344A5A9E
MEFRRLGGALLLAGLAVFATAGPASAHTELQSSDPAEGATLAAAPTSVKLTFGEAVTMAKDPIQVTGPGGAKWTIGTVSLAGPVVSAPVQATGPAGAYTISYHVISDDGDAVTGAVHFTLSAAPASTSGAAPTSSTTSAPVTSSASPSVAPSASSGSGGGFPAWAWILILVVVLAIVAGLVVRSRRRT